MERSRSRFAGVHGSARRAPACRSARSPRRSKLTPWTSTIAPPTARLGRATSRPPWITSARSAARSMRGSARSTTSGRTTKRMTPPQGHRSRAPPARPQRYGLFQRQQRRGGPRSQSGHCVAECSLALCAVTECFFLGMQVRWCFTGNGPVRIRMLAALAAPRHPQAREAAWLT